MKIKSMFFFLVLSQCLFASPVPDGAPISSEEWNQCEQFIQKKAQTYFSKKIWLIKPQKGLPFPIEKDVTTGNIFIHLKGKEGAFIGKGSHKIVSKSILYNDKPCIVARCEIDQPGEYEAQVMDTMRGLRGVVQKYAYIKRSPKTSELYIQYCNMGCAQRILSGDLRIEDKDLLSLMEDLLVGLKGMHERGYIHRDLKRENIFLHSSKGKLHAMLGDLGFALQMDYPLYPKKHICIPDPHCAPETLLRSNHMLDRSLAESYSLGVIFHILLFNQHPAWSRCIRQSTLPDFSEGKKRWIFQHITKLYHRRVEEVKSSEKGLRADVGALTMKMLQPDVDKRISVDTALIAVRALLKKWR